MRKKYIVIIISLLTILLFLPSLIFAASVTVKWNANTDADLNSYRIYYGTASRTYNPPIPLGLTTTTYTIDGLEEGKTYYFSMTAVDAAGNESGYSNEISKTIPLNTTVSKLFVFLSSDCSDKSKNFIINGSPVLTEGFDAKTDSALQFTNRDSVQFGYSSGIFDHSNGAMSFWYRPDLDSNSWSTQYLFMNFGDDGRLRFLNDGRIEWRYNGDTKYTEPLNLEAGLWYHFIFRWWREDANIRRVIIKDDITILDDSTSRDKPADPTVCYLFNRTADSTAGLTGSIDDFCVLLDPAATFTAPIETPPKIIEEAPTITVYSKMESGKNEVGQDFTVNGSPTLSMGIDGKISSAMQFANRQSFQFNYSDGLFDHSKASMSFWFKPDSDLNSWGSDQYIFNNFGDGGRIKFQKDGRIEFRYNGNSTFTEPIVLNSGIWYHFIFRWWREDNNIRRVVIKDDTILLDDTTSKDAPSDPSTCYLFNRTADSTAGIIGTIDELYISSDPHADL